MSLFAQLMHQPTPPPSRPGGVCLDCDAAPSTDRHGLYCDPCAAARWDAEKARAAAVRGLNVTTQRNEEGK